MSLIFLRVVDIIIYFERNFLYKRLIKKFDYSFIVINKFGSNLVFYLLIFNVFDLDGGF